MRPRRVAVLIGMVLCVAGAAWSCSPFDAAPLEADGGADGEGGADAGGADAASPDLVGYWSFDEGSGLVAHDRSGHGHDGTLGAGATWATGKVRGAVSFDGKTGAVVVPKSPSLDLPSSLTIAMWVRVAAFQPDIDMRLFTRQDTYDVKLNTQAPQLSAPGGRNAQFDYVLAPNEWHHIAMTFASGVAQLYVDGASRSPGSNTFPQSSTFAAGGALFIGSLSAGGPYGLNGLLDEVRLYSRVLEPAEITALATPAP